MRTKGKVAAFHIGVHKTGTSAIQHYLHGHQDQLRRHRITLLRYSELSESVGWGEHLVADPGPFQAHIARFLRNRRDTFLVGSHENMVGRPFTPAGEGRLYPDAGRNIAALGRALDGVRVKIVLSIRPIPEFLESAYLQTVHQGHYTTFDEWIDKVDLDSVSWRPIIDCLHATFGSDAVEILDFQTISAGQAAYIRAFLARIDPRLDFDVEHETQHNRSVSARGLTMALAANPFLKDWPERRAMRDFLQRHFSNVDFPRPVLLSAEQKRALADRYGAEYDELVALPATRRRPAPAVGGER